MRELIQIDEEKVFNNFPELEKRSTKKFIEYINSIMRKSCTPTRALFIPDLKYYAHLSDHTPDEVHRILTPLSILYPQIIKAQIYFPHSEEFHLLELSIEDLEILYKEDRVYYPDNPKIYLEKAGKLVRYHLHW